MDADLTPAQAILAVLGPIGVFLAGIVTLFVRRHLQHFDEIARHLDATRGLDAELAVEMRLSRESRERDQKDRTAFDAKVIELVRQELTDQRHAALKELILDRVSGPPEPPVPPRPEVPPDVSGQRRRVSQR